MRGAWTVRVQRVYQRRATDDGTRVLVDRLWPRGLSKVVADLDEWCREIAPSSELRTWYSHDPEQFEEFQRRYRLELDAPERSAALTHLRDLLTAGNLTLLTATTRPEISQAFVLAAILRN